jgi:hypothetical protein
MASHETLPFWTGLASIPTVQRGLSRRAIARFKTVGLPVVPLLRRVGLTPEPMRGGKRSERRLAYWLFTDFAIVTPRSQAGVLCHGVFADPW